MLPRNRGVGAILPYTILINPAHQPGRKKARAITAKEIAVVPSIMTKGSLGPFCGLDGVLVWVHVTAHCVLSSWTTLRPSSKDRPAPEGQGPCCFFISNISTWTPCALAWGGKEVKQLACNQGGCSHGKGGRPHTGPLSLSPGPRGRPGDHSG